MYSLQVEDIHKRYGSHEVLRGVSLRAGKGDVIMGSLFGSRPFSGGGKGIRTPDLLHAMETRYQLRHTPACLINITQVWVRDQIGGE